MTVLQAEFPEDWSIEPSGFEKYMTVTAILNINQQLSNSNEIYLAAFVDNECRGAVSPILVGGQWMYFLMVYSNTNYEEIQFKIYNDNYDIYANSSSNTSFVQVINRLARRHLFNPKSAPDLTSGVPSVLSN